MEYLVAFFGENETDTYTNNKVGEEKVEGGGNNKFMW